MTASTAGLPRGYSRLASAPSERRAKGRAPQITGTLVVGTITGSGLLDASNSMHVQARATARSADFSAWIPPSGLARAAKPGHLTNSTTQPPRQGTDDRQQGVRSVCWSDRRSRPVNVRLLRRRL